MAIEGARLAWRHTRRASEDGGDLAARTQMLLAAFAGGAAIGMGLGPAHAIAVTCGDQGFHHGILSGIGLVAAVDSVAAARPDRHLVLCEALGLDKDASLAHAVASLMSTLGLPASLRELGYRADNIPALAQAAHESFFNLSAFYHPSAWEYETMITASLA